MEALLGYRLAAGAVAAFAPQHPVVTDPHGQPARVEPLQKRDRILARGPDQIAELGHGQPFPVAEDRLDPRADLGDLRPTVQALADLREDAARQERIERALRALEPRLANNLE